MYHSASIWLEFLSEHVTSACVNFSNLCTKNDTGLDWRQALASCRKPSQTPYLHTYDNSKYCWWTLKKSWQACKRNINERSYIYY